jgi:hypothetical protein
LPAIDQIEGGLPRNRFASICCANSARRSGLSSSAASPPFFLTCLRKFPSLGASLLTCFDPRSPGIVISVTLKQLWSPASCSNVLDPPDFLVLVSQKALLAAAAGLLSAPSKLGIYRREARRNFC